MAYAKDTIKLGTAKVVFDGVRFEETKVLNVTCAYKATLPDGTVFEDTGLTRLCKKLWAHATTEKPLTQA